MDKALAVFVVFWGIGILCFFMADIVKWIRGKKDMSYITQGIGTSYPYSSSATTSAGMTNLMAETIHSGGVLHLNNHGVVWTKPNGNEVDISKAAEIFWFFLAQHPEIVEQFNAIEKIKES